MRVFDKYFKLLTMTLSTRVGSSVQLTEPIRPTKAIKQMRDQLIQNGAHKKAERTEPGCIDYQPGKTRMAAMHKATISAVHEVILFLVHETTLPAVRIEPRKAVISLLVNIKPTRSCGTSKNVTVHMTTW